jgi:hypothetical protein
VPHAGLQALISRENARRLAALGGTERDLNRLPGGGRAHPASQMLVDKSVWVDHLLRRNATLVGLLEQAQVWTHAFVVGELACGNLAQRNEVLSALTALPHAPLAVMTSARASGGPSSDGARVGLGGCSLARLREVGKAPLLDAG